MLLSMQNLSVAVGQKDQLKTLIENVNFSIPSEAIVALVGGSGSGKTTTGLSILQLLAPELKIRQGKILFEGKNLLDCSPQEMQCIRGKEIGMIFQEPLDAFNPVYTIEQQIAEVLECHSMLPTAARRQRVLDLLDQVEIGDPLRVARSYPHQLSGGMRQRAMIAQAIAASPRLLIADEPTSSLDVTLQARIIALFKKLRQDLKLSILLITHDLGVVQHLSDEVGVMCAGQIVEFGKTSQVLCGPQHEYTQKLLQAL